MGLTAFIPPPPKKTAYTVEDSVLKRVCLRWRAPRVGKGIEVFKPPHIVIGGVKRKSTIQRFFSRIKDFMIAEILEKKF